MKLDSSQDKILIQYHCTTLLLATCIRHISCVQGLSTGPWNEDNYFLIQIPATHLENIQLQIITELNNNRFRWSDRYR